MISSSKFDSTQNRIYLSSPINALVEGIYEQNVSLSEIQKYGDFGLGTFNDLDGEMVMMDGEIYRVAGNGVVETMGPDVRTPFACVTFFRSMSHEDSHGAMTYPQFLEWLMALIPSPNLFYAFRVEGEFIQVKTRSVSKQDSYRPLVEVAAEQQEFEFHEVRGTLVGFYTPVFMASLNVPGLHLHFLSTDRTQGGHLISCHVKQVRADIQFLYTLELALPLSVDYLLCDFQRNINDDLEKAEK